MPPHEICRTCAMHSTTLTALSVRSDKYGDKCFHDMLRELTQLNCSIESADSMPQTICNECLQRLSSAYDFVRQAQQAHEHLSTQCLDELPIDIPQLFIKSEIDIDDERLIATINENKFADESENAEKLRKWNAASDSENNDTVDQPISEDSDEEYDPTPLRRSNRKIKPSEAGNNLTLSPIKRRRGRPPHNDKIISTTKEGRHACNVCGKTFSWFRDMQRHARVHFEQASHVCESCGKGFLRKDKYMFHLRSHEKREAKVQALELSNEWRFAERLYSSGRLKRIECKLCGLKFLRIHELRQHLSTHVDVETLSSLTLHNDVVKVHFSANSHQTLNEIKQQVCADIAAKRLDRYCAVVNAHGYELCLSDSDEEPVNGITKYKCGSCRLLYTRKHRLIRHTLEEHTKALTASAKSCNICKVGFVCNLLYEHHMRTQCHNELKQLHCTKCPGKFMWVQNLEGHACSFRQFNEFRPQGVTRQCCLCDEHFGNLAQLRVHLPIHRDGHTGVDANQKAAFFRIYYPNGLACNSAELSSRIAADYAAHDYGRYYNAFSNSGNELDLYDSDDSDDETVHEDQANAKAVHTCALCGETTTRLRKLLEHQNNTHAEQEVLPFACKDCAAQFVCTALLMQHRRRVCAKSHAKYNCTHCNLRFVWLSNYELHLKIKHASDAKVDSSFETHKRKYQHRTEIAPKLQCDECEKVFLWRKDLTRHQRMHQPNTARFECNFCERKFHRKDGLKSHLRVHGAELAMSKQAVLVKRELAVLERMPVIMTQLCNPHGCKQIQCMICMSYHTKISDLRTHLRTHQYAVNFSSERSTTGAIAAISRMLYPELEIALAKQLLVERIMSDVVKEDQVERFYSITNEAGYELSLDSSETESDSESEVNASNVNSSVKPLYVCDLCRVAFPRKHLLYTHQLELHEWQEASRVCVHCNARFVDKQLLDHHYRTLCRNTQKRFLCRKCPLRFRWKDNLKLHNNVAHQESKESALAAANQAKSGEEQRNESEMATAASYDCGECQRSFTMQKDLTRHMVMHDKDSNIHRCHWCPRRFYRLGNLLQHIERHGISAAQLPYAEALINANRHPNGTKTIMCKVCETNFETIAALRSHLQTVPPGSHHDYESLQNYSITNRLGYELHIDDSETDEETKAPGQPISYTCSMCQLSCSRKYELHQHQQAMHRLERINDGCNKCIFKSVSKPLIAHHMRLQCSNIEKQFKCIKCSYKFMWEANLILHMQMQHTKDADGSAIMSPNPAMYTATTPPSQRNNVCKIFRCTLCPRRYTRKDRLTAHMKKFHASGSSLTSTVIKPTQSPDKQQLERRFLCAFCGKAVSSSSNLIIHMRRHTGEKPFKCDFCDMAFPRSSDLQCHRRTHTGERPHVCTVCQRGFARSYKLQQHMRIHNGERPYKCTYCEKSFTQSNDLTLHIRRHTGERPYQCGTCGESFIQGTGLRNHRMQHGHYEAGAETTPARRNMLEQFVVE